MDSVIGTIIQFLGILLITLLFVFLAKSHNSTALKYWKAAWLALSFALFNLFISFNSNPKWSIFYYLGEYVFAFLLIFGCRNYSTGEKITAKSWFWLIPGLLISFSLTFFSQDFGFLFNLHTFILAVSFAVAFFALKPAPNLPQKNFGGRVMRFALGLLALDFFHYTIIFSLLQFSVLKSPLSYLAFNPIIDLVLEILLGFGMVIVLMERFRQDVEEANRKLETANDKLKELANVDPLTTAFTRHAFYSFLQKHNQKGDAVSGCAGVFDIDNLKPINDRFGHAIGDIAISSVSHAIRSLIRSDDLIFRWGGDEFFVVMLGCDKAQAIGRMKSLNALLEDIKLFGLSERISIGVSFGFADFNDISELEKAVADADAEMYRAKQQNKNSDKTENITFTGKTIPETSATLY